MEADRHKLLAGVPEEQGCWGWQAAIPAMVPHAHSATCQFWSLFSHPAPTPMKEEERKKSRQPLALLLQPDSQTIQFAAPFLPPRSMCAQLKMQRLFSCLCFDESYPKLMDGHTARPASLPKTLGLSQRELELFQIQKNITKCIIDA